MSQKQHQKQLARAKAKRQTSRLDRQRARNRIIVLVMVFLMVFSLVGVALVSLLQSPAQPPAPSEPISEPADELPADDAPDEPPAASPDAGDGFNAVPFEQVVGPDEVVRATIETSQGEITVELDPAGAPLATNNFVTLAEDGFYDGVIFHRVIEGFMIQGGDPTGTGSGGPGYSFPDQLATAEALVAAEGGYTRGTLAMANAGPDTNGSQFFIMHAENYPLPPAYTVFGQVLEGIEVVDAIATSQTDPTDRPVEEVAILAVRIERG